MNAWDGLNRRKFPRAICPCLVTVRKQEGEDEAALTHTENIGVGGVCVIFKKAVKIFSPVSIELDLLDLREPVRCKGKIVWSVKRRSEANKKPLCYDTGVEFVDMSEEDRKRIETGIARLLKQGKLSPYV